jgi:two-component system, OmpR family, response regulator RegX3
MLSEAVAGVPATILVVEDEPSISSAMKYALEREGFRVQTAADGRQALSQFRSNPPALVLLDLMLPEMPGLDVCKQMRAQSLVPILMVTAKDSESDKIVSLEIGADDYITKPFSMLELVSRIRAHLRRASMVEPDAEPATLSAGDVEMDIAAHRVWVRGAALSLPPKEFALLRTLLRGKGRLMTRDALIAEVWGPDYFGDTRTLDVHVKRLRGKIEADPHEPRHLKTVRGLGYKFDPS